MTTERPYLGPRCWRCAAPIPGGQGGNCADCHAALYPFTPENNAHMREHDAQHSKVSRRAEIEDSFEAWYFSEDGPASALPSDTRETFDFARAAWFAALGLEAGPGR